MARSVFDAPQFKTEEGAFAYVEAHLWPNGPVCPHCGNCDGARIRKMAGKTTRMGLYKCNECRKPFTVRMGTIFESSHLALHLWLQVIHLMCASKKGISTRQIQRMLDCSMKTAWFLTHRIREAMKGGTIGQFGSGGGIVEADETFIGREPGIPKASSGTRHKMKVLSLVDRTSGAVRSYVIDRLDGAAITPIVLKNVARDGRLATDKADVYRFAGKHLVEHKSVNHGAGEFARGNVHTNTVEGYFSVFKRGMIGTYQHCAKRHLQRYVDEFDFRYSNRERVGVNDTMRAEIALKGFVGKRLTYRAIGAA